MSILRELLKELSEYVSVENYTEEFFDKYYAFRIKGRLEPVRYPHIPQLDKFVGIERQKSILLRNTEQFVKGFPANDVLLWGARGTGKSSLVKALLGIFASEGLRLIQITKSEIPEIAHLYELLRGRKKRFILFFDDLSFEPEEESFKLLKSLMEGDIEERPPNVLVYATSNRRNLIPEKGEEEKFPEESLQERISLVERFGIRLQFPPMDKRLYLKAVSLYLRDYNISLNEEIERSALMWATERGSFSGRVAYQFVKDYVGRLRLRESS
ncbi:ATP-binding protein [Aquifex pyrophilus]